MKTSELEYELPQRLIAQHPCEPRDAARLLVVERASGRFQEDVFRNLTRYLRAGDALALNDTRVIRARLRGHKDTGGQAEVFLLHQEAPGQWTALVRPSAKIKPGTVVHLAQGNQVRVGEVLENGRRRVRFNCPEVLELLEASGEIPLPPYIHRNAPEQSDAQQYQTIYAAQSGAVAAPTAGLHFTEEVFCSLDAAGIDRVFLTLHVGYGTFKPISAYTLEEHRVDPEEFFLSEAATQRLNEVRGKGGRIVAVGTTATRVLETQFREGRYWPGEGLTNAYIYPPYEFRGVDLLQTNFHLPHSSLLALVCAFAGTDLILEAYRYAVQQEFRFYSYGDAMLIL